METSSGGLAWLANEMSWDKREQMTEGGMFVQLLGILCHVLSLYWRGLYLVFGKGCGLQWFFWVYISVLFTVYIRETSKFSREYGTYLREYWSYYSH